MTTFSAEISWKRGEDSFIDGRYSRGHNWTFDGGLTVPASASPHNVPLPFSIAENVDPEEAYVAALSSCHMLFYLWLAAKRGFVIDSYLDAASGLLEKIDGKMIVSRVDLRPRVSYSGEAPRRDTEEKLHHEAHELCFLANSVKTVIEVCLD